jgi:hypothetical protein
VRVHTSNRAAKTAAAVNALAYTVGQTIFFADGQFAPGTQSGQRLLAHELAHVVQQTRKPHNKQLQRFSMNEHAYIGNTAYEMARFGFTAESLRNSPLAETLRNGSRFRFGERVQTFGGIVADGDFFATFEDLIRENEDRPGRLGEAALATRNITHFTPHNIRLWEEQHNTAVDQMLLSYRELARVQRLLANIDPLLQGARAAILRDDYDRAEVLMNEYRRRFEPLQELVPQVSRAAHHRAERALMREAFAEHFLTDAFSAGHIITPRAEILREAGVRLESTVSPGSVLRSALLGATWGELGELRAQARSLAWHDLDNYYGVEVQVSASGFGPWIACGDNCSTRTSDTHWNATKASVIRATTESIKHLWNAALTGTRPTDNSAVKDLVPRPTWRNYPNWDQAKWRNQLRYIRGDSTSPAGGEQLTPWAIELSPIEHCTDLEPGCYDRYVGTPRDWIERYSFNAWVRPWISRVQATAADRYRF